MLGCYYDQLPHWVVDVGCYAITIRCKGTLPKQIIRQLAEINESLQVIPAQSAEALQHYRRSFYILEAYLDNTSENTLFNECELRRSFSQFLKDYSFDGLEFQHWVIMPNHVHLLTKPFHAKTMEDFQRALRQFKLRTTNYINRTLNRSGSCWQKGWYDRWVRNEIEFARWRKYLAMNPVKAGLCQSPKDWIGHH